MRPTWYLIAIVVVFICLIAGILFHARGLISRWEESAIDNRALALVLGSYDLSISSEARYIRHLSLSEAFAPFQDVPCGLDLLPSGTFFPPPAHVGSPGGAIEGR